MRRATHYIETTGMDDEQRVGHFEATAGAATMSMKRIGKYRAAKLKQQPSATSEAWTISVADVFENTTQHYAAPRNHLHGHRHDANGELDDSKDDKVNQLDRRTRVEKKPPRVVRMLFVVVDEMY